MIGVVVDPSYRKNAKPKCARFNAFCLTKDKFDNMLRIATYRKITQYISLETYNQNIK